MTSPRSSSATPRTSSPTPSARRPQAARADRRAWLARLARERGNLRVAFERSLRAGQAEDALRIAIAFARTLPWDAHAQEVRGWLAQALADFDPEPSVRRAAALYWDGQLALAQGAFAEAETPLEQALTVAQDLGDAALVAHALAALGRRAVLIDSPAAGKLCDTAVALARGLRRSGAARRHACSRSRARVNGPRTGSARRRMADEALALYREAGDPYGIATALGEQGFYDIVHGRLERAEQRLSEAVELRRQLGDDRRLVEPLIDNAWLDLARGSGEAARRGFEDCLALARHVGDQFNVAEALAGLSAQAALDGEHIEAARLAGASTRAARAHRRAAVGVGHRDPGARADRGSPRARRGGLRGARRRGAPRPDRRGHRALPPASAQLAANAASPR